MKKSFSELMSENCAGIVSAGRLENLPDFWDYCEFRIDYTDLAEELEKYLNNDLLEDIKNSYCDVFGLEEFSEELENKLNKKFTFETLETSLYFLEEIKNKDINIYLELFENATSGIDNILEWICSVELDPINDFLEYLNKAYEIVEDLKNYTFEPMQSFIVDFNRNGAERLADYGIKSLYYKPLGLNVVFRETCGCSWSDDYYSEGDL